MYGANTTSHGARVFTLITEANFCGEVAKVHVAEVLALISEMSYCEVGVPSQRAEVAVLISNARFYGAVAKSCNREYTKQKKDTRQNRVS